MVCRRNVFIYDYLITQTHILLHSFSCPYPCDIPATVLHDCFCYSIRAIPFLDTLVSIQDGKLVTDLYRKPTDRCMYLLPSSCHPTHTTRNIPYSLCNILVRIYSNHTTLLSRLEELSKLLLSRNYDKTVITIAINRSLQLSRTECLKKVVRKPSNRVVYVTTYHPALPSYSKILDRA